MSKDIFKAMGITVANDRSLVQSPTHQVRTGGKADANQPVRKGLGMNAADALNAQLMNGGVGIQKSKVKELKGSHGEEFHGDIHESAKILDEQEEVKLDTDACPPAKKSLSQEELFLRSFKRPSMSSKPSKKAPRMPKDAEQIKQEKQVKRELGVKKGAFKNMSTDEALDGLINFAPDSMDPELIANIHENSDGVVEKRIERSQKSKPISALDDIFSVVKGESKFDFNKDGELDSHEKHHKKLETKAPVKKNCAPKKGFIKSAGPGGIVMDFGPRTGNAMADAATALLNQHADPVQAENANYHRQSYGNAIEKFVTKGEAAYMGQTTPFGHITEQGADMINKPMDQQVLEAYQNGEFDGATNVPGLPVRKSQAAPIVDATMPAPPKDRSIPDIPDFHKSQVNVGGIKAQAQSPTDAAVIEMMKGYFEEQGTQPGMIVAGGPISVTAGGPMPAELEALKQD